jgi:hypothetical protein
MNYKYVVVFVYKNDINSYQGLSLSGIGCHPTVLRGNWHIVLNIPTQTQNGNMK